MYDKKYFIEKFTAIPNSKWITRDYANDRGCCAYGHCGMRKDTPDETPESDALMTLFMPHEVASINDGQDPRYQQETPKARILAALNELP